MKCRIFIGSSSENLEVAEAVQKNLGRDHHPTVWTQGVFGLGKSYLESLVDALDDFDAAVFVLAPDDQTTARGQIFETVRDNVIYELGLFTGRFGRDRTFMLMPKNSPALRIPSDLLAIQPARYDAERPDRNWGAAVSPACNEIREMLGNAFKKYRTRCRPLCDTPFSEALACMNSHVNRTLQRALADRSPAEAETLGIKETQEGFRASLGGSVLNVQFGRIQDSTAEEPECVVALPANEFFDDDCIHDVKSALGAYINHAFPDQIEEVQRLVARELTRAPSELVERETDCWDRSFGVGRCVYLHHPLSTRRKLILVSVTTKRAGDGLRCEPHYLYEAMRAVSRIMNDRRLRELHVPVMGSGHGGLPGELALLHLILAIASVVDNPLRQHHLHRVTIVVFLRADADVDAAREEVHRVLTLARSWLT